jgi:DNA-directed RNA polymerase specialized sigma24 family protein
LDQLADPRSLAANEPPPCDRRDQEQKTWLRHQLQAMEPLQRDLLLGRVLLGCTWVELGRQLGLHPRMAERRCNAALRQLRGAAERWQPAQTP